MTIANLKALAKKYNETDGFERKETKISSKPDIVDRTRARANELLRKLRDI